MNPDHSLALVEFFEQLTPKTLERLAEVYTANAYFKDPFNEVHTLDAIRQIFSHMFVALDEPRFTVTTRIAQGAECFLVWEFRFRFRHFRRDQTQLIHGGSHLRFEPDGRVCFHRDYWDAAEELYEKLPAVGLLMRWLRRRANS